MTAIYNREEQKKAMAFTFAICVFLMLLFFIIKWNNLPATSPLIADEMMINLGNDAEGWGEEQPLTKGNPATAEVSNNTAAQPVQQNAPLPPTEDPDEESAPLIQSKQPLKSTKNLPTAATPPKNQPEKQVAKVTFTGLNNKNPGNNKTEDNGFKNQGKDKTNNGDIGQINGDKDSYGQNSAGSIGGPKIINGNRKIKSVRPYKFNGNLKKGTVLAIIMVDAQGKGQFVDFAKGSPKREAAYATAIRNYLLNMEFDKQEDPSKVTVQFNFDVD